MSDPDQNAAGSGFGRFVPGFEFLQNLAGQAAGGLGQGASRLPNLGSWVAPTFNVEDLEKRIEELKAVHFWLDQNSKALVATIQALEVQKMTLATLQSMNLSMGDVANSLKVQVTEAMAGFAGAASAASEAGTAPAPGATTPFAGLEIPPRTYGNPASEAAPSEAPPASSGTNEAATAGAAAPAPGAAGVIDPLQWWGALSQQFQQIASQALQDAARRATPPADDTPPAPAPAGPSASAAPPAAAPAPAPEPARAAEAPRKSAPRRRAAAPAPAPAAGLTGGDWPMPSAFFQMPGFPDMSPAPARPPAKTRAAKTAQARPAGAARKTAASGTTAKKPAARKTAAKSPPAKKAPPATGRR